MKLSNSLIRSIRSTILEWYFAHGRKLPWRETKDPYAIWLSEIIMQQTRIEQGTPYYEEFIKSYKTVFDLAKAPEQDVLRLWQGLGYYSRARNMHHTAKVLVENHKGIFPSDYESLIKLRGIGDYTASEILSYCFNKPYSILDGNVVRLLSRLFEIRENRNSAKGKKLFKEQADQLLEQENPGEFNQALMDIGAGICTPANPLCNSCPLQTVCIAFQKNIQNELPLKSTAKKVRKRYLHYFLIQNDNDIYIRKRDAKDIWQNLYDLPLIEKEKAGRVSLKIIERELKLKVQQTKWITTVKHLLSHQELHIHFYRLKHVTIKQDTSFRLIALFEINTYPFPKPIIDFFKNHLQYD
ncbi:MAG: A/G-specific adenine glycosylase [Bacteroidetes bacterium]|nr:A/G-specific adenine glycosylase [Bacteroidota bacterium]